MAGATYNEIPVRVQTERCKWCETEYGLETLNSFLDQLVCDSCLSSGLPHTRRMCIAPPSPAATYPPLKGKQEPHVSSGFRYRAQRDLTITVELPRRETDCLMPPNDGNEQMVTQEDAITQLGLANQFASLKCDQLKAKYAQLNETIDRETQTLATAVADVKRRWGIVPSENFERTLRASVISEGGIMQLEYFPRSFDLQP